MNKKILASILACAIAVSTASVAFADEGDGATTPAVGKAFGEITPDVSTEAQSAIVDFSVPTTLTVGLDPFQAGDKTGSQVYSESQGIYNKSNIPIRVIVKAGVDIKKDTDGNNKVDLKDDPGDVTSADITNTNKEAYVELVAEKVTATTDRSGAVVLETVKLTDKDYATEYAAATGAATDAKTDLQAVAADGSLTSQISFALQAATYAADRSGVESFSAFAADNKGVASFRFMGSLNANATGWSSDDMEVKVVYDVNGMGAAAYDALIGASAPSTTTATMKAVNVYSVDDATAGGTTPTPSDPSITSVTPAPTTGISFASPNSQGDADIVIVIGKGSWSDISLDTAGVTFTTTTTDSTKTGDMKTDEALTETDDYTWDGSTGTLTILKGTNNKGICKIPAGSETVTYTIHVKDSGTNTKTLTTDTIKVSE